MTAELPIEAPAAKITADELRALLRRKYPADQYAMLYEVRDAAGHGANNAADVLMIGLWPSRGCMLEGMEIKVSRSDWLRELKRPQKAEAFVPYCNRWWIVTAHPDIVKPMELPPTWGLMAVRGRGLGVIVEAPPLQPKPVDRSLLAAMLKRATDTAAKSPEVRAAIEAERKKMHDDFDQQVKWRTAALQRQLDQLQGSLDDFEKQSGIKIHGYNGRQLGEAVKRVLSGDDWQVKHHLQAFERTRKQVEELHRWFQQNAPELVEPTEPGAEE